MQFYFQYAKVETIEGFRIVKRKKKRLGIWVAAKKPLKLANVFS